MRHVRRALEGMTGVVRVTVDLPSNQATVEHFPDRVDAASLVAAIRDAGYEATVRSAECAQRWRGRFGDAPLCRLLKRLPLCDSAVCPYRVGFWDQYHRVMNMGGQAFMRSTASLRSPSRTTVRLRLQRA